MEMKRAVLFLIHLYRAVIAPVLGPCCRFYPSCSVYAEEALLRKGLRRGLKMAAKRLFKCHPFHQGGFDPVEP